MQGTSRGCSFRTMVTYSSGFTGLTALHSTDTLGIQREPFGLELGNASAWRPTEYTFVTLRRLERHLGLLGTDGVSAFIDKILL